MLFDNQTLDGIAAGRVTVAFRRWKSPRVRVGTKLRTRIGLIEVMDLSEVDPDEVADADISAAGFADRGQLDDWILGRDGCLFRVELQLGGADPRIALRNDTDLGAPGVEELTRRLGRLDAAAPKPWTWETLHIIDDHPGRVSTELAVEMGLARDLFKRRVRRLKELGLTESLEVGYRLSPRGRALLEAFGPSNPRSRAFRSRYGAT